MKIYNVESPEKFLEVIQQCKGSVELISKQGDRLNLKSELTNYLAVSRLFADTALINDIELVASDPDDVKFLLDYMMQGK